MKFGVCGDPSLAPALHDAGFDYLEVHVQLHLKPDADEETFAREREKIGKCPLPCTVANCFIPGNMKLTGPDVQEDWIQRYVETAVSRAATVGVRMIVFGSGASRTIPPGWDRNAAWDQLVKFVRNTAKIAWDNGICIAVEPLNASETNVLVTVAECARLAREASHVGVGFLVDAYHWFRTAEENEADIVRNADLLIHAHIATVPSHFPPGLEECDFSRFVRALETAKYDKTLSIESQFQQLGTDARVARVELKKLFGQ